MSLQVINSRNREIEKIYYVLNNLFHSLTGFPAFMAYQASALRASQQNTTGTTTQIPSPGVATTSVGEVRVTAAPSAAESVAGVAAI